MSSARSVSLAIVLLSTSVAALAQTSAPAAVGPIDAESPLLLPAIAVIGSKADLEKVPGAGFLFDGTDIRTHAYDDINQVIRFSPGVYTRQEDGYGLFPNVSLRGVSTTRNAKITVMEDGIPMAPAAYADPAAYYTPNIGRMSGLEILKGSSQIRFGPETTGGVMNYLSTPIPAASAGRLLLGYGSDNDRRVHASYGSRVETAGFDFGYLVEHAYRETDGFKSIDTAGVYPGSNDTGFRRHEPMVKLRFDFKTAAPQSFELKYGRTELHADETYVGLTDPDFRADPFRRYASSRFDRIDTEQERYSLRYAIAPSDALSFTFTAYRTDFARNWYKLNDAGLGATGAFRNASEILAGQHGAAHLDVLRSAADGRLRIRANNRTYGAEGLELLGRAAFELAGTHHKLEFGARWHSDFVDRFQWDDVYAQAADGSATLATAGIPGTQDNRRGEADAFSVFLQDRITVGRLDLLPGLRFERIDYTDIRRSTALATLSNETARNRKTLDTVTPGLGLTFTQSENLTWIAGAFRGVSPPRPGSASNTLTEETSLGLEAGLRYNNRSDFSAELILFRTTFDDLIVEANAGGGGGAGQTSNIGEVDSQGLELALAYDPSISRRWSFRNPWHLSFTATDATLGNDVNATGNGGGVAESIFSGGRKGNKLPYIPSYQIALGTGLEFARWSLFADLYFQPATWASANNEPTQINPDASAAAGLQPAFDARYGRVDAYLLLDAAVHYRVNERLKLKLAGTNLFGWEYIASRVPIGTRPGAPRTFILGADITF